MSFLNSNLSVKKLFSSFWESAPNASDLKCLGLLCEFQTPPNPLQRSYNLILFIYMQNKLYIQQIEYVSFKLLRILFKINYGLKSFLIKRNSFKGLKLRMSRDLGLQKVHVIHCKRATSTDCGFTCIFKQKQRAFSRAFHSN